LVHGHVLTYKFQKSTTYSIGRRNIQLVRNFNPSIHNSSNRGFPLKAQL